MLGLFYRQYQFCDSKRLKQMYLQQNVGDIEHVQKFNLRICSKEWEKEYTELLDYFKLPALQNLCLYLKICHLYKIIHGLNLISIPVL